MATILAAMMAAIIATVMTAIMALYIQRKTTSINPTYN